MYISFSVIMVKIITDALSHKEIIELKNIYFKRYRNKNRYVIDIYPARFFTKKSIAKHYPYFPYLIDENNNIIEKNVNLEKKILIISKLISSKMTFILFSKILPKEIIYNIILFRSYISPERAIDEGIL